MPVYLDSIRHLTIRPVKFQGLSYPFTTFHISNAVSLAILASRLEDMDKSHLYLRSNRSWNGIGTDEFESNYTVVDHPILRGKAP